MSRCVSVPFKSNTQYRSGSRSAARRIDTIWISQDHIDRHWIGLACNLSQSSLLGIEVGRTGFIWLVIIWLRFHDALIKCEVKKTSNTKKKLLRTEILETIYLHCLTFYLPWQRFIRTFCWPKTTLLDLLRVLTTPCGVQKIILLCDCCFVFHLFVNLLLLYICLKFPNY